MTKTKVVKRADLTQEKLKEFFHYNPETGDFVRIKSNINKVEIGQTMRGLSPRGYIVIRVNGTQYLAHRLVWLFMYGFMSTKFIDHINGNRTDNRLVNLREATNSQNLQNQTKPQKGNRTGFLGVIFTSDRKRYIARITKNNKQVRLGKFDTPEEAHQAYLEAKRKLHEFCTI